MNRFAPRAALVDAGLLLALGLVASFGFRDTFNGWSYLVAATAGLVIGLLLAHLATVLAKPAVLVAVFAVVAFFLFGGAIALHSSGALAVLPLPDTLSELADQSVHGWKDLLTTLAPVDGGPLLTLPYLMGLVAGAAGMTLAGRLRSPWLPVLAPVAYLAAVILLGIQTPTRLRTIGLAFAALTIVWIAVRARRTQRRTVQGGTSWRSRAVAGALVLGAAAAAVGVAPVLPGADARERVVLRSYVTPPFDVGQYPSPLASFRRYTKGYRPPQGKEDRRLYERELMRVEGLPEGALLRFAALDQYNGTVWGAANQAPGTSGSVGSFQRVGTVIRDEGPGREVTATVTLTDVFDDLREVWLPTTGAVTDLAFEGERADDLAETFRYNLATDTGVVPQGLRGGDSYTFTAHVPGAEDRVTPQLSVATGSLAEDLAGVDFRPVAQRWGGEAGSALEQVLKIAQHLQSVGRYTDGGSENDAQYPAGHSVSRLSRFSADGQQIAGDDEQYAAMLTLLATQAGLPARVVVGAKVPAGGIVKGEDVRAWIEIRDTGGDWHELPTEAFMSRERPPEDQPPTEQELTSGEIIPPPVPVRPPAGGGDPLATDDNRKGTQEDDGGFSLPGWLVAALVYGGVPLLVVGGIVGGIVGGKAWRRRRRRTRGAPATRLTAAWREVLDAARDLGHGVTARRTRREQAAQVGHPALATLARSADHHVFGRTDPTEESAASYWSEVDRVRAELLSGLGRWRRIRARVSLASFRRLPRPEAQEATS
ncbi:transglutaminase-like domain-containing protein [Nocardioides sp. L-11A]|uniref:transglutaminase-like domain-containing protein n=1 Tax=Nocardioides sp. L-11A TaxID=3043848 RepID=UPI00249A793D|nr:transglutaminase-like domain-containing protein [Nocardioides sp. L-11A]